MQKIIIYHPSKYLGGTEILFSRVIQLLLSVKLLNIHVVDYPDGILMGKFHNAKVKYHDVINYNTKDVLEGALIISSARNIYRVFYECVKNDVREIKPMFWLLHPSELYAGYCLGSTFLKKISYTVLKRYIAMLPALKFYINVIKELDINKNLWLMDDTSRRESEWMLNYQFRDDAILPLITNLDCQSISYPVTTQNIKILVISRLDDFKVYGVEKLITDIIFNKENNNITIEIIGDGEAKNKLIERYNNELNIVFHGYVENAELNRMIENNEYSILFAMGTSALEGCSRSIPTVLLPCADKSIKGRNNVYKYIHMNDDFSLGEYIDTPFESTGYITFDDVISTYSKEKYYLREKTKKFFLEKYEKDKTNNDFLNALGQIKSLKITMMKTSLIFEKYTEIIIKQRSKKGF